MDRRRLRTMADMGMGDMAGMDMGGTKGVSDMKGMPGMDMSKPGMDHGAMPGMDHGSMPGMDMSKPSTSHGSMPGMDHGSMPGMDMSKPGMNRGVMPGMDHGSMPGMDHKAMPGMGGMDMSGPKPPTVNADGVDPKTLAGNLEVDNVAMSPKNRLAEAGDGLDGNGRRVLTYAQLKSLRPAPHAPPVQQEVEFHLTGNMQRFVWGFDGKRFSEAGPVRVKLGDRVRFVLINDTMMEHPIHLHGFLFAVENGQGDRLPLKHTINVKPGERLSFVYTADTPGHCAFNCHLLFHMDTAMFC